MKAAISCSNILSGILLILFFCSTIESRITRLEFSSKQDEGICKTMVDPNGGYTCEEHTVTTQDGYILSLQRIIPSSSAESENMVPVLLQHGVLVDGITWFLLPPKSSLAFNLVDDGFQVWIANGRGTKYSFGHTSLTPDDEAYWDWTWDELTLYDESAIVQYLYEQTGQKLHYVGHSQGTLVALAAFSKNQLVNMLRSAALLSPIAYLGHITSPLCRAAVDFFIPEELKRLGFHEFDPRGEAAEVLLQKICQKPGVDCTDLATSVTGPNCCINSSTFNVLLDHEPQATSTKNLIHFAQMIRSGTIKMYDYGDEDDNMKYYGQPTPPEYDMTSIPKEFPLFLSYGGADALSDVNDVELLLDNLKDHQGDKLVVHFVDKYAHIDFIMSEYAEEDVYDALIDFLKKQ